MALFIKKKKWTMFLFIVVMLFYKQKLTYIWEFWSLSILMEAFSQLDLRNCLIQSTYSLLPLLMIYFILFHSSIPFHLFIGAKTTYHHLPYHFVMIYILPAIFTAGVASSGTEFGYTDTSSAICSMSSKEYKDVYFFYIPILVFSLIGLIAGKRNWKKINKNN